MLISQILTVLRCRNRLLDVSSPLVMSILNVTPDSFYSASRAGENHQKILKKVAEMVSEGASIIDIGGVSTRPGAPDISIDEELTRVLPVIEIIAEAFPSIIVSIDTYRSEVAERAIQAGASMINDISGGQVDNRIWEVAGKYSVAYVLMHMRGMPDTMQNLTDYQDVIGDILKYFVNKLRQLHRLGMYDIIIDPGFGFAKTMEQNYKLIDKLDVFRMMGYPVMVGVSRKSTLSKTVGRPVEESLEATTALHMAALLKGASILRVHDVKPAIDAIAVYQKLLEANTFK